MEDLPNLHSIWRSKFPNDTPPGFLFCRQSKSFSNNIGSLSLSKCETDHETTNFSLDYLKDLLEKTEDKILGLEKSLDQEVFIKQCLEKIINNLGKSECGSKLIGKRPDLLLNNTFTDRNIVKVKSSSLKPKSRKSVLSDARRSLSCLNTSLDDLDATRVWLHSGENNSYPFIKPGVIKTNIENECPVVLKRTLSDSAPLFTEPSEFNQSTVIFNESVNMSKVNEGYVEKDIIVAKLDVQQDIKKAHKPVPLPRRKILKDNRVLDISNIKHSIETQPTYNSSEEESNLCLHTSSDKEDTQIQTNTKNGRDLYVCSPSGTLDNSCPSQNSYSPISALVIKPRIASNYDNVELTTSKDYPFKPILSTQNESSEPKVKGVKDLCASSIVRSFQISNSLAENTDSDLGMKKFYSSRRERVVDGSVDVGQSKNMTGTYRKIQETDNFRGSTESIDSKNYSNSDTESVNKRLTPSLDINYPLCNSKRLSNGSNKSNTNSGTFEFDVSKLIVRPVNPPLDKPKRRKEKQANYENWTINAVVTQTSDSASEEDDDDVYQNMPFFQKPSHGSKDSGLCDDLSNNETQVVDDNNTSFSHDVFKNIKEIDLLNKCSGNNVDKDDDDDDDDDDDEDYSNGDVVVKSDNSTDSTDSDNNKSEDNISIASDIVFISTPAEKPLSPYENWSIQTDNVDDEPSKKKLSPAMERVAFGNTPNYSSGEEEIASNDSFDETDNLPLSPHNEQLKMRQLILQGILESERGYLDNLDVLVKYKSSLEAAAKTSQPVISKEDIDAIFFNIEKLHETHQEFVSELSVRIQEPVETQLVAGIFKVLIMKFPEFDKYMANYQNAVATIHRCCQESQTFQDLVKEVGIHGQKKFTLEDMLFKPVNRIQRNSLVLHDIKKFTPTDHPDYVQVEKALSLSQYNLGSLDNVSGHTEKNEERRNLVKTSFIVELDNTSRKLRCMFLFSDLLICTKRESHRGKISFHVKWFMPLASLSCDTRFEYKDEQKFSNKENIDDLKLKIGKMKSDLREELKKESDSNKHWSISGMAAARNVEKLKKKIQESEGQMILSCPKLPFKLTMEKGQARTLLMTTDYEREEWRETILSLCKKCTGTKNINFTPVQAQELIDSVKELPQVNRIGTVIMQKDEEVLDGTLNVTIHKLIGLNSPADTYCCLEMDSFGHFFMKAKTNISSSTADPSWNEDFELELDGSQTLRILCYQKGEEKSGDTLLGRGAFELGKDWLKSYFQEKTVSMNEVSLVISVKHTAADKTMRRTPSKHKLAVFGVKISTCTRRESKTVPTIVKACVSEVEKRGLEEIGLYRVSGVTSEVQKLKKIFDKNIKAGMNSVADADIHAVTGLLKLYFRELPEPLFTESKYPVFKETIRLSDEEAKEKCMLSLLHNLPDANYYTIVHLIDHLVGVAKLEHTNKMSLYNLSTIFGPTLMAPAVKENSMNPIEMMNKGAEEVMHQSQIVGFYLKLAASGKNLWRSAQC
ncbi:active breakpoint cluster region-related protein isoform X1 [Patella vulgata]|uniref:active breakpoint cluster region-related protein isoform X1 n=2 Tax=Patella vulgata TaxID=6465 RepID=UPI00217F2B25|nr:active breakpoint cluster region-related protein isoform X1 [Patella vulgata]